MMCFSWHYYQFPSLLFFFVICSLSTLPSPFTSARQICSPIEGDALLQFKQFFTINSSASDCQTSYPKTDSWKENTDCCSWEGVSCSSLTGHVIGLDLSCSQLYGNFPSNASIFLLKHLNMLNLAYNDFKHSKISPEFGQFTNLTHLDLSYSGFSGQVPSEISHLSKLVSLNLSSLSVWKTGHSELELKTSALERLVQNFSEITELSLYSVNMSSIDHSILTNLSSSLRNLQLAGCGLRGTIPDSFFRRPNLRRVELQLNSKLTVHLPKSNWTSSLEHLILYSTHHSGQMPDSIGELKSLETLEVTGWKLNGPIPTWIGNLSRINSLSLPYNHLTGPIPSFFANLTQLSNLDLSYNMLNGTLPSWVFNLPSLEYLELGDNRLTGHINEFQSKSLISLSLRNNMFQGQIPNTIFELVNLTSLDLSSNNFSGIVELDKLSKLKSLAWLYLSNNSLSLITDKIFNNTLPNLQWLGLSFCNLTDFPNFLRSSNDLAALDLSNNRIRGPIPEWMWSVGKDSLYNLILSHNLLSGSIQFPWQNLQVLDLQYNQFEGLLPIPPIGTIFFSISRNKFMGNFSSMFCNLNSLEILDLSYNNLTGKIPSCLFNFSKSLSVLDLRSNHFDGTIPTTFRNGCALNMLNFHGNQFQGLIPRSMANCRNLEVLDIGNNNIKDTFPHWLDSLPELQVVILRSNKFHGFLNESQGNAKQPFSKLRVLDLSSNGFVGFLPTWYLENLKAVENVNRSKSAPQYMQAEGTRGSYDYSVNLNIKGNLLEMEKVLTIFTSIDFSDNKFEGVIPGVIGRLSSLKGLNLSHNNLNGHIPGSIGNLTELEWLDLSSNNLVGEIPGEFRDLTSLAVLNLSNNQLVGPIPGGKQFNTFENSSYGGNSGLCGFPLSKLCHEIEEQNRPPPASSEPILEFGWKVVLMGYGCGLILGAIGGCLVFQTRKPKWVVNLVDGKWGYQKAERRLRRED
ncbi:hypothetical protein COLO4_07053 [Corchorus olitorius]|uniref:Leucine-rich repeat-containing N-terminal plant-type domain-containing protein n=1 Tax=Corchorus olitorius TaxID=93759 RepID=A0A1R3KL21_9ROSI|nr:hypothetical protein COLO4_07053 [Corchorus olitorius]